MRPIDKVIVILHKTNDGKNLFQTEEQREIYQRGDGWQLALCQNAANNFLTEQGLILFDALYEQVMKNDFWYNTEDFIEKFCKELHEEQK